MTDSRQRYFSNSGENGAPTPASPAKSAGKQDWEAGKKQQARTRKRQNDIKKAEDTITSLEAKIATLEAEMQKPENATDAFGLTKLVKEQEELNSRLTEQYEIWEQLCEEADSE